MKFLTLALVCILVLTALGMAQENPEKKELSLSEKALTKGSKALLFQTGSDFAVHSYRGILAGKYQLSNKRAIGLKLGLFYNDIEYESDYIRYDDDLEFETDDQKLWELSLNPCYILYLKEKTKILPYFSFGVITSYRDSRNDVNRESEDLRDSTYTVVKSNRKTFTWITGVTGTFGVEIFLTESISISGEYFLEFSYLNGDSDDDYWYYFDDPERNYVRSYKRKTTGFSFDYRTLDIGISVYF